MCNTAKAASQGLPLYILLVLAVCVCSLAVHFIADGLAPVAINPGLDLAALGELAHLCGEHCEDNFIVPFQTHPSIEHPATAMQAAPATGAFSFPISPLLPPPNL
jgi:hypothetical protein